MDLILTFYEKRASFEIESQYNLIYLFNIHNAKFLQSIIFFKLKVFSKIIY